jgi:hypothetical protein
VAALAPAIYDHRETGCLAPGYNDRRVVARLRGGVRWPGRSENGGMGFGNSAVASITD